MPAPVVKNEYQGETFNYIGTENSLSDMPVTQSQTDTKVHKISPVAVSQHENDTTLTNRNETIPTQVPTCTNHDLDYYKKFDVSSLYQNHDKFTKHIKMRCFCSKSFNMTSSLYRTTFSFSVFNFHDLFCLFFFYCYSTSFIWSVDLNHV